MVEKTYDYKSVPDRFLPCRCGERACMYQIMADFQLGARCLRFVFLHE